MKILGKEKQVVELALDHFDKTGEALRIMITAMRGYVVGDLDGLDEATASVDQRESEADNRLREIRDLLYSGAFLPTIRGDLFRLFSAVDKIANRVERCMDFVDQQQPGKVEEYRTDFKKILDLTAECFAALQRAIGAYLDPKVDIEELREHASQVSRVESMIDDIERSLTSTIFSSNLVLAEKLHLAQLVTHIVRVSDQVENAADELELLSLKSII
jgi:predicted phosphate transport protein (TIGR00153 family)